VMLIQTSVPLSSPDLHRIVNPKRALTGPNSARINAYSKVNCCSQG
jgi:hypothetical protein